MINKNKIKKSLKNNYTICCANYTYYQINYLYLNENNLIKNYENILLNHNKKFSDKKNIKYELEEFKKTIKKTLNNYTIKSCYYIKFDLNKFLDL